MAERPLLITIVAILTIILGLILILGGVGLLAVDVDTTEIDLAANVLDILGYATLILGLVALILGFAFLKGWTFAWYLGIIFFGINAILGIYNIIIGNNTSILSLIVALVLLFYLTRKHVKSFFKV